MNVQLGHNTWSFKLVYRIDLDLRNYISPGCIAICTINTSIEEAELVMFSGVEEVLKRTRVHAKDIGIHAVKCFQF